jgi:hypothetical protein
MPIHVLVIKNAVHYSVQEGIERDDGTRLSQNHSLNASEAME